VTPLTPGDIAAGLAGQVRGAGRDGFREAVVSMLDAESAATYTTYRRALGACFDALADRADDRSTVLVPAFCSTDFRLALEELGLAYRRYDVEGDSFAADLGAVESALDDDVLAVVAVNVLGYSSEMDVLARLCRDAGASLVEALGYSLGASYEGERLGTFGDCAVCNFQQGKPIPVGGGMVVSQDPELSFTDSGRPAVGPNVATLAGYAAFSRPRMYHLYRRGKATLDSIRGSDGRITTHPGSKDDVGADRPLATMSDFQGTVAQRVLARLDHHRHDRARNASCYTDAFRSCPGVGVVTPVDGLSEHQHVRFPLVAESEALRNDLCVALEDAGIGASKLYEWPPLATDRFPTASRLKRRTITLPTHPFVDEQDRRTAVRVVRAVLRRSG
jgi:dTDP-4-amino-4,6-dideoxygalactose transaminase